MNTSDSNKNLNRRNRRRKDEVPRDFKCVFPDCDKAYGSDNSLNQHIKLKHSHSCHKINENKVSSESKDGLSKSKKFEFDDHDLFFDDNCNGEDREQRIDFMFECADLTNE